MSDPLTGVQVIVIGAGNAGLCAAISARQEGANVLVVEKAPMEHRGGNSALTANMRFAYDTHQDLLDLVDPQDSAEIFALPQSYTREEFYAELMHVNDNRSDPDLAMTLTTNSLETIRWLRRLGHKWMPTPNPIAGTIPLSLRGAGRSLQQQAFEVAEAQGVPILYSSTAKSIRCNHAGSVTGVEIVQGGRSNQIPCRAVVLSSGGFEANPEMRK